MATNRLTVLNVSEINRDLAKLHTDFCNSYFTTMDENGEVAKIQNLIAVYQEKYTALYEELVLAKHASYSYITDKILTAVLARLSNYLEFIELVRRSRYSGYKLLDLTRYAIASNDPLSKLYKSLVIETENDINIKLGKENK